MSDPTDQTAPDFITLRPIGFLRSGKTVKFQARHQPDESGSEESLLELLPGHNFEPALTRWFVGIATGCAGAFLIARAVVP